MATYILRITTRSEGRRRILEDPNLILNTEDEMDFQGARIIGLYAVLGDIDFVGILEADDNAAAARFALELGVKAGVRTTTLPAIPIGRLEDRSRDRPREQSAYAVIGSGPGGGVGAGAS